MQSLLNRGTAGQRCPECDEEIVSEAINISEGVALCPACGQLSRLSELTYSNRSVEDILSSPPRGCFLDSDGRGLRVRCSLRTLTGFLFTFAFAAFWNSIVSVFCTLAIAGLYTNLIGPLPEWFPAPGMNQGRPEMNGAPMNLGMTLFLCLFLLPFVVIGIGSAMAAVLSLFGRIEIMIDEADSYISTGIGLLSWKRRFDPTQVESVNTGYTSWHSHEGYREAIELRGDRTLKFGSFLSADRLQWLAVFLKEVLVRRNVDFPGSPVAELIWLPRKRHS